MTEQETIWNDGDFTQLLARVVWMASPAVLRHLNERSVGHPLGDWITGWAVQFCFGDDFQVLVLGCGEGWLERSIAQHGAVAHIHAVDFAEHAVARARESAKGIDKISYGVVDLNKDQLEAGAYDVIFAHSVLHHIENLEHAFAQIQRAMKPNGVLLVGEYVGANRYQFSPDLLDIINRILIALPSHLRRGAIEKKIYERKEIPWLPTMLAVDPTEGVRSADIAGFLRRDFNVLDEVKQGGTILQHLLYDIVQNFHFDDARERAMLELICTFEGALVDHWILPSDFDLIAARRKGDVHPRDAAGKIRYSAKYTGADDPDPLGWGRRVGRIGRGAHTKRLPEWALRMLRIALASTGPRGEGLISENWLNRRIEQARYRLSDQASPFDWIIGRYQAEADLSNEDAHAILKLLEVFESIGLERGLVPTRVD